MSTTAKLLPFGSLPLAPPSHSLQYALTPDPLLSSPARLSSALVERPSLQRRARMVAANSHFSHISPLPISFPFRIQVPDEEKDEEGQWIEKWLSAREATEKVEKASAEGVLSLHRPKVGRDEEVHLLAIAPTCLKDCLPNLDVGDALSLLGTPRLSASTVENTSVASHPVRDELVSILSGKKVLRYTPEGGSTERGYAPWSMRYCGHQFGVWAGQLGDGRAISILETPHPDSPTGIYEIQLKGAGRTPYSRTADGLAVLRSSIREFLASETMAALGIPTTRSLSIVHLPSIPVSRETVESAAVVSRIAESFLRIGNYEACNPPQQVFLFGAGGRGEKGWEGMRILNEWVERLLGVKGAKDVVKEVGRRNAKMCAMWQAYGFMHGVMNTDNISLLGLTIDYGPYAFMDIFDPHHICNHTDEEGRYSYRLQPTMIVFAVHALKEAIAPLAGYEALHGRAKEGWASSLDESQIEELSEKGKTEMEGVETETMRVFEDEYWFQLRRRLGLKEAKEEDKDGIIRSLLSLMEFQSMDFHGTFRTLSTFKPAILESQTEQDTFIDRLIPVSSSPMAASSHGTRDSILQWLKRYATRLEAEKSSDADREKSMKAVNPRFVLRQWVLEEVIKRVTADPLGGRPLLMKVLEMATKPFGPWGAEDNLTATDESLDEELREERRFCGLGDRRMLGFQCSCSS